MNRRCRLNVTVMHFNLKVEDVMNFEPIFHALTFRILRAQRTETFCILRAQREEKFWPFARAARKIVLHFARAQ